MDATIMSLDDPIDFPIGDHGDVQILLSRKPEDRLLLRSSTLRMSSAWFKAMLSNRWAGDTSTSQSGFAYSFVLLFDTTIEPPILVMESTAVAKLNPPSGNPAVDMYYSTGSFRASDLDCSHHVVWDRSVEAHRCYFGTLFDEPLDRFVPSNPQFLGNDPIEFLYEVVKIADYYNSRYKFDYKVSRFLDDHAIAWKSLVFRAAPHLLEIGIRLKSDTIFTDAICILAGSEARDDFAIRADLNPQMAELVLKKREDLRQLIRDIDVDLLGFTSYWTFTNTLQCNTCSSHNKDHCFITACFRQFIAKRIFDQREYTWSRYTRCYRKLVADISRPKIHKRFFGKPFTCSWMESTGAPWLWMRYYREAIETLRPLYTSTLSRHLSWRDPMPVVDSGDWGLDEGFTCVKVLDEEIPWKMK
ncbi:MAG: hypothetical protein Q9192_004786 [Flavoplaca navasiana]